MSWDINFAERYFLTGTVLVFWGQIEGEGI